jgi:hypothetical protein
VERAIQTGKGVGSRVAIGAPKSVSGGSRDGFCVCQSRTFTEGGKFTGLGRKEKGLAGAVSSEFERRRRGHEEEREGRRECGRGRGATSIIYVPTYIFIRCYHPIHFHAILSLRFNLLNSV